MSDLYGLVFQKVLYPGWESGLRRRPTLSHLKQLLRSEWYTLDELKALQSRELRKLLDHAYRHSPYYLRNFEERALTPSAIRPSTISRSFPCSRANRLRTLSKPECPRKSRCRGSAR